MTATFSDNRAQWILDYCLTKTGSYADLPFGAEPVCVKVAGRIFAQVYARGEASMVTLKCEAPYGHALRHRYEDVVVRGYHCPATQQPYWNTVYLRGEISDELWFEMIDHAYAAVLKKLPKRVRQEQGL